MNLVDRYVEQVVILLPLQKRDKARKQLHEEIDQMLQKNASDAEVCRTLEKLGDPTELAVKYRGLKPYLIGPDYFYSYLSTLKIASIVMVLISVFSVLIEKLTTKTLTVDFITISIELSTAMMLALFQGLTQAFFWVTVVFVIMEYQGVNPEKLPFYHKKWSVQSLITEPVSKKGRITRTETIFSMLFTIFLTLILLYQPQIIGWYTVHDQQMTLTASLFNMDQLQSYLIVIILLAIFQISILCYKFISRKWTIPLAIINTVYNFAISCLFITMASDHNLFNISFIKNAAKMTSTPIQQFNPIWWSSLKTITILIIIGCCIDSLTGFIKSKPKPY